MPEHIGNIMGKRKTKAALDAACKILGRDTPETRDWMRARLDEWGFHSMNTAKMPQMLAEDAAMVSEQYR